MNMIKIKPSSLGYSIGELREIMYGKMLSKLQYTYAKFNYIRSASHTKYYVIM